MNQDEIIDDFGQTEKILVPASKGKRLTNYFVDMIMFYIILLTISTWLFSEDTFLYLESLSGRLLLTFVIACYYLLIETALEGKTLGKLLTNTRVVDRQGYTPSFEQFVQRSFSRIVPFEALSFLGSQPDGWHDRWSKTMVVDEAQSSY